MMHCRFKLDLISNATKPHEISSWDILQKIEASNVVQGRSPARSILSPCHRPSDQQAGEPEGPFLV